MRTNEPTPRDPVERLMRAAGSRVDPPRERRERAMEAVRAEWLLAVKARRKKRWIVWSIASAAAALVGAVTLYGALDSIHRKSGAVVAKLERVTGAAEIVSGTERRPATPGTELRSGERLETPKGVRAALTAANGASLRVDEGSRVLAVGETAFLLEAGAVYLDSERKAGFEIRTALGDTRDIGTQFEVRLDGSLVVRVREGKIELKRGAEKFQAAAGEQLTAPSAGPIARDPVPVTGPLWDWATSVAPLFKMDGQPAKAFLAWVCHEKGWTLAYADPRAETTAGTAVLRGAFENASPEDALDAVMAVSGLRYRLQGTTLTVSLAE
ncbi:MAG: FecR domain-containing protein [Planctomycetota bacterium]|nr:FecR domain-containing protein [Planctomycetota bacterium]